MINKAALIGDLIKFRLSLAVTLSAVTGYLVSGKEAGPEMLSLSAGVFLLAAGSAALNQFSESDSDARMSRTKERPIPRSQIDRTAAFRITIFFLITGITILIFTEIITACLGVTTIILYNFIYTRLKKISSLAVIPGALVGAIPPLMGFTAAEKTSLNFEIFMFSGFMFMWQLPHFWLILLRYKNDYPAAGFKSLVDILSDRQIKLLVFLWVTISTVALSVLILKGMVFTPLLNRVIIPLNILFILLFCLFFFRKEERLSLRNSFILINSFSLIIMIFFIVNSRIQ